MSKKCIIFETINKCSNMKVVESSDNLVHLSGTFAVCGVENNNHRIYEQSNYSMMVEALKQEIAEHGLMGELEHPYSMNINLENVSHKIDDINIDEAGVVTGSITLLNTPKGNIAKGIVEGGLPIYISSRGVGKIDEDGNVTLTQIKTYDLVGSPGFSEAQLNVTEGYACEQLNESEDVTTYMYYIKSNKDINEEEEEKPKDEEKPKEEEKPEDEKPKDEEKPEDEKPKEDKEEDPKDDDDNDDKNEALLQSELNFIDEMIQKVNGLIND